VCTEVRTLLAFTRYCGNVIPHAVTK